MDADFLDGGFGVAAVQKKLHDFLIGPAVERAFEGGDGGGDARVHVRQRRGGHAGGERAGVETVLGVEDQGGIKDADERFVRLAAGQHVEKIPRDRKTRLRFDQLLIVTHAMERRHDRRKLSGQTDRLAEIGGRDRCSAGPDRCCSANWRRCASASIGSVDGGKALSTASVCSGRAACGGQLGFKPRQFGSIGKFGFP